MAMEPGMKFGKKPVAEAGKKSDLAVKKTAEKEVKPFNLSQKLAKEGKNFDTKTLTYAVMNSILELQAEKVAKKIALLRLVEGVQA